MCPVVPAISYDPTFIISQEENNTINVKENRRAVKNGQSRDNGNTC
jgi:Mlc titration factor MtfA (ptsG expression regulator)